MQNNNLKFKIFLILRRFYFSLCSFRFTLKRGVSLLETLLYVAIVALLTVIVVNTAAVMITASGKARLKRNILGEAGVAVERMVREIRLADSVIVSESVLGAHPGVLKMNSIVGVNDDTPITRELYLSGSTLMMKEGGADPRALTEKVAVTNLVFHHIITSATTSEAVVLELTAEDELKKIKETRTFNATAVLRRSY